MGLRSQVSMLLDHGHPDAWIYPLPFLIAESKIVDTRMREHLASTSTMQQMALSTVPNMNVKPQATTSALKRFTKAIEDLLGKR